ncbi:SAC3 family protein A isoform X1 [Sesamum indicum]|uniref:SAC3 family protein A isoform X1 n=1 Tax=Sesamum indicum TaxID=4182 RepID=A0A6I9TYY2_SESIN|nr:SAC3 family protein A isoform X1 [Sesamum indicum]
MMNQGESSDASTAVEKHQINDTHQVQSSYFPPNCAVASWSTQGENGDLSTSGYNHDQQVDPNLKNGQDGTNLVSNGSTSNPGPANLVQGYSGYAAYPNSDPYGYSSTGYAAYYNHYQQQPGQYQQPPGQYQQQSSQYQQQPSQYQQQPSQYQQQPSQYQQQPSQYQQQPSQYQQQPSQYQPQSNQSYPHHVGAYQNTGAPYQPLSSFQNTGSYAGPASYSSTYYNPGDYQTSGSYTSGNYGTQTNLWHGGQYATYGSHQYPNYTPDSTSAYSSSTAVATSQYQQHYKQWEDYYNQTQTEVSCAPGTENVSVSIASSVNNSVPSGSSGYTASNNQMPAAYTPSWRPEFSSSDLTSVQPVAVSGSAPEGYWKHGASALQNDLPNSVEPHAQKPPEVTPAHESFQNQQTSTFSQGSTALYPASCQFSQIQQSSFQAGLQPSEPLDSRRASKLQIPTNPRIASNLPSSISKSDKDSSMTSTGAKPAYVSVIMQNPNQKVASYEEDDSMLKPGMFPKSLRGYVERALARCKNDRQKTACQAVLKEVITKATADGTLYTKDWDTEPLFPLPTTDAFNKHDTQLPIPTSVMPKSKSPSRRAKSRWEPIPEEKVVDKFANISYGTAKYGGWNSKQFSGGKIENKDHFGTKFSLSDQKGSSKNFTRPAKRQRLGEDLNAGDDGDISSDSDKEQNLTKYYSAAIALADSPEEKKRRENRSKRFDKGHGNQVEKNNLRGKDVGAGKSYARRASAVVLSRTFDESGSRAVEDIDWDALTVKGTCQEIEKRYLRLTSAPDPATVRPEEVLEKALLMVQTSQKNYLYKCDQLKSIRQDLTVQRIRNELTVKVYETHARLAIEVGDLPEYNQCQSQLKTLYGEGITGCHMEFAAYNLLCVMLHSNNNRDLLSAMSRLSANAKKDKAVKHALSVRSAVTSGNYVTFFRLYKTAPNLNTFLMDLYVEKMRYAAVKCMSRSYRPTAPVSYLSQILGFTNALPTSESSDEKEVDGVEECIEWLKAHGACLISDSTGETLLDAKASASSLYMPEPEDAVSHGDASLAVNDFLTRSLA